MPAFLKSPKFIFSAIVALWVVYVIWANFQMNPATFYLLPFATVEVRFSAVVIGAAIFGSLLTLVIQWLWGRRSSKNGSQSAAA
jgi:hypothetical protein